MDESRNGPREGPEQSEFDESEGVAAAGGLGGPAFPAVLTEFVRDDPPPPETPSLRTSHGFFSRWAQDDHVRLLVTSAIVLVVPLIYLILLIGVLAGGITVAEAKDLGAVELFSGLITLAGTVIGYYFGKKD